MKRMILVGATVLASSAFSLGAMADVVCRGRVLDEQGEPAVGAVVAVPGSKTGVPTDIDGNFKISVPDNAKTLKISYLGYFDENVPVSAQMGVIELRPESKMLQDVVVTQSVARTRKTPVALSQVDALTIDTKLGAQEFPEILKTTPGVWATPDGGGFGDSKINMRGFKSENVAVLINGVPINDMEWGGVYWSNWAGLSDVTSNMQTQRGLGAALVSAPSVGGTINHHPLARCQEGRYRMVWNGQRPDESVRILRLYRSDEERMGNHNTWLAPLGRRYGGGLAV